jgi:four helix bundle protein
MPKIETRNSKLGPLADGSAPTIRDFTDLQVWQLARELRNHLYNLSRKFPHEDRYGLMQQLRRAASSITANIAEGFGRYSFKENIQFCRQSRGSAYEVRDHLITATDQGYIAPATREPIDLLTQRVIQTLNGYIRSTQARQKLSVKPKS